MPKKKSIVKQKEEINEKSKKSQKKVKKNKVNELSLLVENFTLVQKTLTDVVVAFKNLEKRFEKFLDLVEKAARKEIGEGEKKEEEKKSKEEIEKEKRGVIAEKDLSRKLDELLEQNRVIAEGILLLEKFIKERLEGKISEETREIGTENNEFSLE